jgi:hypothetical protein
MNLVTVVRTEISFRELKAEAEALRTVQVWSV